jgi:hypothetical protein
LIEIQGIDQLINLSKALKAAGDKELQRELSRGISQAMKPVTVAARDSARRTLPARGGLGQRVAKSQIRTVRRTGPRIAGVRLQAKNSYHLGQLNRGINHHPVFGNRKEWVTQRVTPGWWTIPTEAAAPRVRRDIIAAMNRVANKIERSV